MSKYCKCCGQPLPGSEESASLFNGKLIVKADGLHWGEDGFCHLTKSEAYVCLAMARCHPRPASRDYVADYMENCRELVFNSDDTKIIDVFICKIRARMLAANCPFSIETIWGLGKKFTEGAAAGRILSASDYPRSSWKEARNAR